MELSFKCFRSVQDPCGFGWEVDPLIALVFISLAAIVAAMALMVLFAWILRRRE